MCIFPSTENGHFINRSTSSIPIWSRPLIFSSTSSLHCLTCSIINHGGHALSMSTIAGKHKSSIILSTSYHFLPQMAYTFFIASETVSSRSFQARRIVLIFFNWELMRMVMFSGLSFIYIFQSVTS